MNNFDKMFKSSQIRQISQQSLRYLYSIVTSEDAIEEDVESYIAYEGEDRREDILQIVKACKVFKTKYVLSNQEIPEIHEIIFEIHNVVGKLRPEMVVKKVPSKEPF